MPPFSQHCASEGARRAGFEHAGCALLHPLRPACSRPVCPGRHRAARLVHRAHSAAGPGHLRWAVHVGWLSASRLPPRAAPPLALRLHQRRISPPPLTQTLPPSAGFLFLMAVESIVVFHIVLRHQKREEAEARSSWPKGHGPRGTRRGAACQPAWA